jgi:hypothetical protein
MPLRSSCLRAFFVVAVAALALAGCAYYAQIGPGAFAVHDRLNVNLDSTWNRQVDGPGKIWPEVWTKNGPLLDVLIVVPAIEDGKALVRLPELALRDFPRFRAGSNPADIVELVQGTLQKAKQGGDFVPILVEPARIAERDGIRFEFRFGTGGDGGMETDRHALGYAFEHDKRLYLILFHAAEIHFFPNLRPVAEGIVASARLPQTRTASR